MPDTHENRRRRIARLLDQWLVFWLLFIYPRYYELLSSHETMAIELADAKLLMGFYRQLGHCQWVFGRLEQSRLTLEKGAALVGNAEDQGVGQVYCMFVWIHLYLGNYDEALQFEKRALRILATHFDLRWYAWCLAAASWTCSCMGRWDEAVEKGLQELAIAEQYSDSSLVSFAHWNISIAYNYKGDEPRARQHADLAVAAAPTPADKVWAQSHLGWAMARAGAADEGARLLATLGPLYQACRFVPGEIFNATYLGEAYCHAGAVEAAQKTLFEVLDLAGQSGMKFYWGIAHRLLGDIAVVNNVPEAELSAAVEHFEQSIAILGEIGARSELAYAHAGYGRLCRKAGRLTEARNNFIRALELFDDLGTLIEPEQVREDLRVFEC